jgi:hypothetical protein
MRVPNLGFKIITRANRDVKRKNSEESILISVVDKTRLKSQERSGWVLKKPFAPAFGFKNTPLFPQREPWRGNSCAFPLPTLASLR